MTEYKNLKKKSVGALGIIIALLIVLELCALAMLFSRLTFFAPKMSENVFSLTESGKNTTVRMGYMREDGSIDFENETASLPKTTLPAFMARIAGFALTADASGNKGPVPGYSVYDENTVWQANTNVEIFKFSYENGEGMITVQGSGEDKVIAPGTQNEYTFTLENSGTIGLDYVLEMEAFFSNEEYAIPVTVRLTEKNGGYILGSDETREDVLALNTVNTESTLGAGRYATYTLDWEWAFEGNDEYDTLLGNMAAAGEDLSLTIVIRTTAMQSANPECSDGEDTPVLGDDGSFVWWFVIALLALVGLALVFKTKKAQAEIIYNEENQ